MTTATAAAPAVDVRSTVGPSRHGQRPGGLEGGHLVVGEPALGPDDEHARRRRPGTASGGQRQRRRPRAARAPAEAASPSSGDDAPRSAASRHDRRARGRAGTAWRPPGPCAATCSAPCAGPLAPPLRDAARRRPGHDLVDADLGERLDRQLAAVALRQRLHDAPAAGRAPARRSTRCTAHVAAGPRSDRRDDPASTAPPAPSASVDRARRRRAGARSPRAGPRARRARRVLAAAARPRRAGRRGRPERVIAQPAERVAQPGEQAAAGLAASCAVGALLAAQRGELAQQLLLLVVEPGRASPRRRGRCRSPRPAPRRCGTPRAAQRDRRAPDWVPGLHRRRVSRAVEGLERRRVVPSAAAVIGSVDACSAGRRPRAWNDRRAAATTIST